MDIAAATSRRTVERCGATTNLTVHHRVALKEGGAMIDLENLVALCRAHHGLLEGQRSHLGATF